MNSLPPMTLIEEWTPAQKLIVYDFCRLMCETLWHQHKDVLLEEMIKIDRANDFEHPHTVEQCNLDLPFEDDDLPF